MSTLFYLFFLDRGQASFVPLLYRYIAIFTILSMARTSLATLMPSIYRYASILAILRMALQSSHLISPFLTIVSNSDWLENLPMSSCHSLNQKQSCANLAQRLLQPACIMSCSFLRLITSYNDIASIMDTIPVSTSPAHHCQSSRFDHAHHIL